MRLLLRSTGRSGGAVEYLIVDRAPFALGRREDCDFQLVHPEISGRHAEFVFRGETWFVSDLGSTNGTFVNGIRAAEPTPVAANDMVHFGEMGFRVVSSIEKRRGNSSTLIAPESPSKVRGVVELFRIIHNRLAYPCFQPIFDLTSGQILGWEALGRAATDAPVQTGILFDLAGQCDLAPQLSMAFLDTVRTCTACGSCWPDGDGKHLFVNLHPDEILTPRFTDFLDLICRDPVSDRFRVVLEFPESLACNSRDMRVWIDACRSRSLMVAYDDFGKGQSRIQDLMDAPPDFLKLDRDLVTGLHGKDAQGIFIQGLVEACGRLEVRTIAEGIETEEEWEACLATDIRFGQGNVVCGASPPWELFGVEEHRLDGNCPFARLEIPSDTFATV